MTLVHLNVGLNANTNHEIDKFSLNSQSLSQRSSPTNSSLLTCDSRPLSAAENHHIVANNSSGEECSSELLGSSPCFSSSTNGDDDNHHHHHHHHHYLNHNQRQLRQNDPNELNNHHNHHHVSPLSIAIAKQLRNSSPLIEGREHRSVAGLSLPVTLGATRGSIGDNGSASSSTASSPMSQPTSQSMITPTTLMEHNNVTIVQARRPSRCEHRKSLSDLGYGKIESYTRLQRLGKGTYATVYLGRSRLSNDLVALKEILKEHDEGAPCTAIREISLLRLLRHNNIVTLHDICHTPKKLTLVFEYVGPDLYAYMRENNNLLSVNNIRLLLYQLLRGISFCHSRQVLHRDLKPQNLLINSRGELKICDFGLARAKSIPTKSYSNEVVTLWYRPPDVLLGNTDYDHSIDMWGIGCIFYEMASGRTFFPGSSVRQQLYLIFSNLGSPNRYNWPEIMNNSEYKQYDFPTFRPEKLFSRLPRLDADGINLLVKFLRFRPSERISAEEAQLQPFFANLPEKVHHLSARESIFDVPGVYMTGNPGQRLSHM